MWRASGLGVIQRPMLGILMSFEPDVGEPIEAYVRRRGRETAALQHKVRRRSDLWAEAVV